MSDKSQFLIKFQFSQYTLQELKNPLVHNDLGCQFNQEDIQTPQVCPVCENESNKIEQDSDMIVQLEQKNERQLIYDRNNKTILQMKRKHYAYDIISTIQEVKELQKNYYKKLRKDQNLTISKIQEMNQERNQIYANYLRNLPDADRIPILFGVINNKLLLFYHAYKIHVNLTLIDSTNPKIRQKLKSQTHGILQQFVLIENYLYFLYTKQNMSSLYRGEFSSFFTNPPQNNQEPTFQIVSLANLKLEGPARLIQVGDKELLLIGTKICYSITQQNHQQIGHKIEFLRANSFCHLFNNNQILMVNQEEKDQKKIANYSCYDLSQQKAQPNNGKVETLTIQKQFNNYLIFADKMILYTTSELQNEKCEVNQFFSWAQNQKALQPLSTQINITNHQSYMLPVKIASTQKQINNITCQLIGLKLPKKQDFMNATPEIEEDESDVFPALLVYNGQSQSFEVELI